MPAVKVTVNRRVDGAPLDAWGDALSRPEPGMQAIADVMERETAERFATRTDPWGAAWAPVSQTTIEIRRQRGDDGGSLRRTRYTRMMDAGRRVVVGLAASFARAFQFGAPNNKAFGRGRAPIPGRAVLPARGGRVDPPAEVRTEMRESFWDAMRRTLRRR